MKHPLQLETHALPSWLVLGQLLPELFRGRIFLAFLKTIICAASPGLQTARK